MKSYEEIEEEIKHELECLENKTLTVEEQIKKYNLEYALKRLQYERAFN